VSAFTLDAGGIRNSKFIPDVPQMRMMLQGPDGMTMCELHRRANIVLVRARAQIPIGHVHAGYRNYTQGRGNLRDSLFKKGVTGATPTVIIGSNDPVALYVHEGTRPHIIKPRKATVLVFTMGSETVFAKTVHHPGAKPNRFLSDNLKFAVI
jgi:hypothetical protein